MVGVARLELAALRSRTVRATKLRYTPKILNFCKTLARLGARRACPLGLAFLTALLEIGCLVGISLVLFTFLSQTKLRYTPKNFYNQFRLPLQYTSNRAFLQQKQVNYLKNYLFDIIFYFRYSKLIANLHAVIYNNTRDGAWCSGSTWASDSHCVGSIPIAPANANTLICEGVSFIFGAPYACIQACAKYKRNSTRSVFALSVNESGTEVHRKMHITTIFSKTFTSFTKHRFFLRAT